MRGSAANEFKESDWDLFKAEMRQALEEGADGERFDWSNPKTGNSGSIRVLETTQAEGETCRKAAFRNVTAKGTRGQSVHYLCRQENGAWQFAAASAFEAS
jgi:surface antigen